MKKIFVRYGKDENGYKVFVPDIKKIILSRSVLFNENAIWSWNTKSEKLMSFPVNRKRLLKMLKAV